MGIFFLHCSVDFGQSYYNGSFRKNYTIKPWN